MLMIVEIFFFFGVFVQKPTVDKHMIYLQIRLLYPSAYILEYTYGTLHIFEPFFKH